MTVEYELKSTNDLERLSAVFKSVDWVVPAYMPVGGISTIAAMLEREPASKREEILEWVLPGLYDEERLASMLLGLYNRAIYIRDFKVQITEAIEAWHAGLHHAAVATMIPVLEGIVRKIAKEGDRNIGSGTKKLIDELDELIAKEDRSPHRYGERIVMLTGLRDFFAERLLKNTDNYDGLDQLNRHGILHGIFEEYGAAVNFLRLITQLDLLCFAMVLAHGGSSFAPDRTPESKKLADYYRTLKQRSIEAAPFRVV
jgi:hypothetical protein